MPGLDHRAAVFAPLVVRAAFLCIAILLPAVASADEDPPDPGAVFDKAATPPPDPRLAANQGLWLEARVGMLAMLRAGYEPSAGGSLSAGWGLRGGLVLEGQAGVWHYQRTVGENGPKDDAIAVPILAGVRYRFVTLWNHPPVLYAAAHVGPVVTTAWYLGPKTTRAGFGLQVAAGVQIPLGSRWLLDCSAGYLLDAGGTPEAGTLMRRFGTGHAILVGLGLTHKPARREPYDPLGLRKL